MRRAFTIWLVAALAALSLLTGILVWQRFHPPLRSRSFLAGDPVDGAFLFEQKGCSHCHALSGPGTAIAPSLGPGSRTAHSSGLVPLVTTMWNHAPAMWQRMQQENVRIPPLTEGEVSDLFAFLYLVRYMDDPGDIAHGRQLFTDKGCIRCHAVRGEGGKIGPDLADINGVDTPIEWSQALWNHSPAMESHLQGVGIAWPRFEKNEMTDLLAFVRDVSSGPRTESKLLPADPSRGRELFKTKSCVACHSLNGRGGHVGPELASGHDAPMTMVQFAGVMWNHSPQMFAEMKHEGIQRPVFEGRDMADLMAFFNSIHYFEPSGSVNAGRGLFAARGCSRCHGPDADGTSLGPSLRTRALNSMSLAAALWRHGPEMYRKTQTLGIPWPKLEENDLGDLFAFLNEDARKRQ